MSSQPVNPLVTFSEQAAQKLLVKLLTKVEKAQDKYDYYDADNDIRDVPLSIPKKMIHHHPGVGWASRAVNTLSDRVVFDGFAGDKFGINDYFDKINARTIINKAKHDAYIAGCAFVAVSDGEDPKSNEKLLVPFTATEATGIMDQNTGLLKLGVAVTRWAIPETAKEKRKYRFAPADYILFTPEFTAIFENKSFTTLIPNPTGRCLLHAITHRHSADRPLGKSRLTNTARRIIQELGRVKRRYEIAQEFYSTPQRYISGLAQGAKKDPNLDSAIGKVWTITQDDEGGKPEIGQLTQMTISQFSEAKKDLARDFCAETALTLRNLGYETANPTSAESLTAMSDDLLLEAQNSQTEMGEQIKQIAITLYMANNNTNIVADQLKAMVAAWLPIFQVDIGAAGDAMYKLFQAMPELVGTIAGYRMLGVSIREAEALQKARTQAKTNSFMVNGGTK